MWHAYCLFVSGFEVTLPDPEPQICKAILLHVTPAKKLFQGFMQYNEYYCCPYCLNPGEIDRTGRDHV